MFSFLEPLSGYGDVLLRLFIAIVFLVHALPKLKNSKAMSAMMKMPAKMIFGQGVVEVLAAIALVFSEMLAPLAALLLAIIMVGAIFVKKMKWKLPFAMPANRTGWEFDLVLLGGLLILLLG